MRKWLWIAVLLFAGGDIVTTVYGLNNGATEGNPVVEDMVEGVGAVPAMIFFKVAAIAVGLAMENVIDRYRTWGWVPALALLVIWAPATVWNLYVITA